MSSLCALSYKDRVELNWFSSSMAATLYGDECDYNAVALLFELF